MTELEQRMTQKIESLEAQKKVLRAALMLSAGKLAEYIGSDRVDIYADLIDEAMRQPLERN